MKSPGNQAPNGNKRAAPYSKAYTSTVADLTTEITQSQGATSGGLLLVTTVSPTFAYKDCAGNTITVALGAFPVGAVVDFRDIAMTAITTLTNATFVAYWHANHSQ